MHIVIRHGSFISVNVYFCRKEERTFQMLQKANSYNNLILKANLILTSPKACDHHGVKVKELQIPVPYGHIAAKSWGRETGTPILALHGLLDNAGTFDKLIPLLSPSFRIVAIDIPGHGFSSHKPLGCFYSPLDTVIDFKRVVDHLQWTKFSIIGHSMGAAFGQLYASIFPETVQKLVAIDQVKLMSVTPKELSKVTKDLIERNLKVEEKLLNESPVYSVEAAMERLKVGSYNEITDDSARILLTRGTSLSDYGKGCIFTRDLRVESIEYYMASHNTLMGYMSALKCEMLMILANNPHHIYKITSPEIGEFIECYKKHCKRFLLEKIEGNHFVHLNNPERIAPLINSFLG